MAALGAQSPVRSSNFCGQVAFKDSPNYLPVWLALAVSKLRKTSLSRPFLPKIDLDTAADQPVLCLPNGVVHTVPP
jgi:hypothetical protein